MTTERYVASARSASAHHRLRIRTTLVDRAVDEAFLVRRARVVAKAVEHIKVREDAVGSDEVVDEGVEGGRADIGAFSPECDWRLYGPAPTIWVQLKL